MVVNKALYEYFVNDVKPEDYIKTNRDIFDYCAQTKIRGKWKFVETSVKDEQIVPRLMLANTHYNVIAKEFKNDEKRPDIICNISKKVINKPFMGFNRAQFSVIEASVLVSRLRMLPIEKILKEIEYLKIGIEKTAGPRESEAWKWIEDKIQEFEKKV